MFEDVAEDIEAPGVVRVLFVTPFYYPELKFGGPPKRLHAMAREITKLGHVVQIITFDSEAPRRVDQFQVQGINVQYLSWIGKQLRQLPTSLKPLREAIAAVDLVHCFGLYNLLCPVAAFLAEWAGKPFLLEPMGMFVPRNRSYAAKAIYNATATKWMARKAAAILATSELEAQELTMVAGRTALITRSNGIDVSAFCELPARDRMRAHWKIKPGEKLVLYVGRISAKKRLIELVRAFSQLSNRSARLVIAGPISEADYFQQLRQTIEKSRCAHQVQIADPVYDDDLLAAYSAADLFVLPSENENFGNSAAEAVAANVPVLLTETCGIAPLIHRRAGLAVPLGVESIADGIRKMLDPEFRDQMTARREEVKRELSWEEPVQQTIALYERIVAESRKWEG